MDREERIRRRAYELWVSEGRPEGRETEHWRQAGEQIDNDDRVLGGGGGSNAGAGEPSPELEPGGAPTGAPGPDAGMGPLETEGGKPATKTTGSRRKLCVPSNKCITSTGRIRAVTWASCRMASASLKNAISLLPKAALAATDETRTLLSSRNGGIVRTALLAQS